MIFGTRTLCVTAMAATASGGDTSDDDRGEEDESDSEESDRPKLFPERGPLRAERPGIQERR
jgi:hypothetical protein